MPERSSSAGDSIAPAATTTVGAWTVSAVVVPSSFVTVAATPLARPSLVRMRSARAPTTKRAPSSAASCRKVFIVDCLQPFWQPA